MSVLIVILHEEGGVELCAHAASKRQLYRYIVEKLKVTFFVEPNFYFPGFRFRSRSNYQPRRRARLETATKNLHQAQWEKREWSEEKNPLSRKLYRDHFEFVVLMTEDGMTLKLWRSDVTGRDDLNLSKLKPPLFTFVLLLLLCCFFYLRKLFPRSFF